MASVSDSRFEEMRAIIAPSNLLLKVFIPTDTGGEISSSRLSSTLQAFGDLPAAENTAASGRTLARMAVEIPQLATESRFVSENRHACRDSQREDDELDQKNNEDDDHDHDDARIDGHGAFLLHGQIGFAYARFRVSFNSQGRGLPRRAFGLALLAPSKRAGRSIFGGHEESRRVNGIVIGG